MTHISKQQLGQDHLNQLFLQLGTIVASLDKNSASGFLNELLGKEEKVMLAKRLAAIVMCIEGNSSYRIWQLLKMSPSTTERIKLNYEIGKYKDIEKVLKSDKKTYVHFWKTLEVILQAGMPPMGRGRWKSVLKKL